MVIGDRVSRLWNAANFLCRQNLVKGKAVPSYAKLCSILKTDENYRFLPSDIAQEVLKKLSKAWTSYFRLVKLQKSGKPMDRPGLPRYRKDRKTGKRPFDFIPIKSLRTYSLSGGIFSITLPSDLRNGRLCIGCKGILRYRGILKTCELKYDRARTRWYAHITVEISKPRRKQKPVKYASGDIGAKRAIAVVIEGSKIAHVFSARELWKDYKYWTRRIAREQSRLSAQGLKTSRQLKRLYRMRKLRVEHGLEALARKVALILKREKVTHFAVGYPKGCREEMQFGKNNALVHNFWSFDRVLNILEKHCTRRDIELKRVDEQATSDVCNMCGKEVKRPVRSVVVCPEHGRYHADVNAAINILLKNTPGYGDGVKATPAWVTHEWNKHLWLPRARSLRYVSQVLQ
ncbi:transposase, partial [candidate division KSB1 bacterium]